MTNVIDVAIDELGAVLIACDEWTNSPYSGEGGIELEKELDKRFSDRAADFIASHGEIVHMILLCAQDIERDGIYKARCREKLERLAKMEYLR